MEYIGSSDRFKEARARYSSESSVENLRVAVEEMKKDWERNRGSSAIISLERSFLESQFFEDVVLSKNEHVRALLEAFSFEDEKESKDLEHLLNSLSFALAELADYAEFEAHDSDSVIDHLKDKCNEIIEFAEKIGGKARFFYTEKLRFIAEKRGRVESRDQIDRYEPLAQDVFVRLEKSDGYISEPVHSEDVVRLLELREKLFQFLDHDNSEPFSIKDNLPKEVYSQLQKEAKETEMHYDEYGELESGSGGGEPADDFAVFSHLVLENYVHPELYRIGNELLSYTSIKLVPGMFELPGGKKISVEDVQDYVVFATRAFRHVFEKKMGVSLDELTIIEQFYVLQYVKTVRNQEVHDVQGFIQEFGIDGLRTLIGAAHAGPQFAQDLLGTVAFDDERRDLVRAVFVAYGEVLDIAEDISYLTSHDAYVFLYERALEWLRQGVGSEDTATLARAIQWYRAGVLGQGAAYKDIRTRLGKEQARENIKVTMLSQADIDMYGDIMLRVTLANRQNFMDPKEVAERKQKFLQTLVNPDTVFYGYIADGELLAFVSFTDLGNNQLLAESLNIDPALREGTGLGADFFEVITRDLGKQYQIKGFVHAGNRELLGYYESIGYQVGTETNGKIPITYSLTN